VTPPPALRYVAARLGSGRAHSPAIAPGGGLEGDRLYLDCHIFLIGVERARIEVFALVLK
jgi:hypothetical protein